MQKDEGLPSRKGMRALEKAV